MTYIYILGLSAIMAIGVYLFYYKYLITDNNYALMMHLYLGSLAGVYMLNIIFLMHREYMIKLLGSITIPIWVLWIISAHITACLVFVTYLIRYRKCKKIRPSGSKLVFDLILCIIAWPIRIWIIIFDMIFMAANTYILPIMKNISKSIKQLGILLDTLFKEI